VTSPEALSGARFLSRHPEALYGRSKTKNYSKVPDGHYFILTDDTAEGDTDAIVFDSRTVGWISERDLMGRATFRWWPPNRWGRP
jgi:hypothetical protein